MNDFFLFLYKFIKPKTDETLIEGPRLKRAMPKCTVETLEGASHAALQEAGVDLPAILRRNGFLPRQATDPPPLSRDARFTPPSPAELDAAFESLAVLRGVVSPVFFSTRADGQIVPGLDAVPLNDGDRPVLLVGNHQTLAPDLGFLIQAWGSIVHAHSHSHLVLSLFFDVCVLIPSIYLTWISSVTRALLT